MPFSVQSVQVGAAKCRSRYSPYRSVQQNAVLGAVRTGRCSKMPFSVQSVLVGAAKCRSRCSPYRSVQSVIELYTYFVSAFSKVLLFAPDRGRSCQHLVFCCMSVCSTFCCMSVCSTFCCMSVCCTFCCMSVCCTFPTTVAVSKTLNCSVHIKLCEQFLESSL